MLASENLPDWNDKRTKDYDTSRTTVEPSDHEESIFKHCQSFGEENIPSVLKVRNPNHWQHREFLSVIDCIIKVKILSLKTLCHRIFGLNHSTRSFLTLIKLQTCPVAPKTYKEHLLYSQFTNELLQEKDTASLIDAVNLDLSKLQNSGGTTSYMTPFEIDYMSMMLSQVQISDKLVSMKLGKMIMDARLWEKLSVSANVR